MILERRLGTLGGSGKRVGLTLGGGVSNLGSSSGLILGGGVSNLGSSGGLTLCSGESGGFTLGSGESGGFGRLDRPRMIIGTGSLDRGVGRGGVGRTDFRI